MGFRLDPKSAFNLDGLGRRVNVEIV